jgi:thiol-disulfide isomerase/thioredoxin
MMRWVAWGLVAMTALVGSGSAGAQGLVLEGVGGGRLTEADLNRGNAVLVFWASWSPRSRQISDSVQAVARSAGGRASVSAVNYQEDAGTVQRFLADRPLGVPVYLDVDGALAKKFRMANLPGLLILKNGVVAYQGKLPDDVDRVLAEALK